MFVAIIPIFLASLVTGYDPLVIWHGMGDSCCNPLSIGKIMKGIENMAPGIYIHSLEIGNNMIEDVTNGFFMEVNKQVEMACSIIGNDSKLSGGYNAMGFSQGGQFLRAVAQRCPTPPMKILLSVGGQHQGVYGFPRCNAENSTLCWVVRKILNLGAYSNSAQEHLVQAEYWHDSDNEKEYKSKSNFLSRINLERETQSDKQDKLHLLKLKLIVFVMFSFDTMVEPKESEWFGFYAPGNPKVLIPLNQSDIYIQDRLGLKEMDINKKLRFIECPTDHLQFSEQWFMGNLMPFINGTYV